MNVWEKVKTYEEDNTGKSMKYGRRNDQAYEKWREEKLIYQTRRDMWQWENMKEKRRRRNINMKTYIMWNWRKKEEQYIKHEKIIKWQMKPIWRKRNSDNEKETERNNGREVIWRIYEKKYNVEKKYMNEYSM